jgi:hypothetical protein
MKSKTKRKKALLVVIGCVGLFCLVVVGYSYYQEGQNNNLHGVSPATPAASPTASPAPTATTTPSPPSDRVGSGGSSPTERKSSHMDAVNAAVQAVNILSTAPFLALDQQRQLLRQKVAPSVRSKMRRDFPKASERLLKAYGYLNDDDALIHLQYQEVTTKYKVTSFGKSKATAVLYSVSNYISRALNSSTYEFEVRKNTVWTVQTVRMEWHNGHWLYVSATTPPKGKSNEFYANYMEGLKPYVYKKSENDG